MADNADSSLEGSELPLHESWGPELERHLAVIELDTAPTTPWEQVRAEMLALIRSRDIC